MDIRRSYRIWGSGKHTGEIMIAMGLSEETLNEIFDDVTEVTCLMYQETFPSSPFDVDYSLVNRVKNDACPGLNDVRGISPRLENTDLDTFDAHLLPNSPAIDAGTPIGATADEFDGRGRDDRPDNRCVRMAFVRACLLAFQRTGKSEPTVIDAHFLGSAIPSSPTIVLDSRAFAEKKVSRNS